jgi:hypothetical protein
VEWVRGWEGDMGGLRSNMLTCGDMGMLSQEGLLEFARDEKDWGRLSLNGDNGTDMDDGTMPGLGVWWLYC